VILSEQSKVYLWHPPYLPLLFSERIAAEWPQVWYEVSIGMKSARMRIGNGLLVAALLTVLAFVSVSCGAEDTHTVCPSGCDYSSIQAAIDAAQSGGTIAVHSGTYNETVNVNKQLTLRGIDTGGGKPVVDAGGTGSAMRLSHDGIVLDGFTAINASSYPQAGIVIYSNDNFVSNNTASHNSKCGIRLASSSSNTLTDNTANTNNYYGILLDFSSSNNTLKGNTASNNDHGIYLYSSSSNILTGNTITNNTDGLFLDFSNNNRIYNNYFDNAINAYDNGTNIWNITPTAGSNSIGGSWLGGNYWRDYAGEDTNGDGLGDSMLPYNSSGKIVNGGDWLPLVEAGEQPISDTGEDNVPKVSGFEAVFSFAGLLATAYRVLKRRDY